MDGIEQVFDAIAGTGGPKDKANGIDLLRIKHAHPRRRIVHLQVCFHADRLEPHIDSGIDFNILIVSANGRLDINFLSLITRFLEILLCQSRIIRIRLNLFVTKGHGRNDASHWSGIPSQNVFTDFLHIDCVSDSLSQVDIILKGRQILNGRH